MHRNVLTYSWYLSGRFLFQASTNSLSVADSSSLPVSAWILLQSIREVFPFSCHRGNHENNFLTPPPSVRVWVESAECKRQKCGITLHMCYFFRTWNMSPLSSCWIWPPLADIPCASLIPDLFSTISTMANWRSLYVGPLFSAWKQYNIVCCLGLDESKVPYFGWAWELQTGSVWHELKVLKIQTFTKQGGPNEEA